MFAFAASGEASYITGSEILVDGGFTLGDTPQVYEMVAALAQSAGE